MSPLPVSDRPVTLTQSGPPRPPAHPAPDGEPASVANGLTELVHHRDQVDAQTPLAEVQKLFQNNPGDYRAIVEGNRVVGLCSRTNIGFMLGSRYGFALYGGSPVTTAQAPRPLIYRWDTPMPRVLDEALSRTGSEFYEDIILVDEHESLVGLAPVPSLARVQLRLFAEQLDRVVAQDKELRQHNLELFQINHQLRQSQGRYKVLFENNALGVALLDTRGNVVAHNQRFEQLLGLSARPPSPAPFILGHWINREDQSAWLSLLNQHEKEGPKAEPKVTELRFDFPEGPQLFELHTSWVNETGQICIFLENISEQRSLEQRMARQEKQSMLDTLVAGVAHELNNKLTPVMGFAELLHALAPENLLEHTRCIRQSAEEAAQIIRQLLNLSRPGSASDLFDVNVVHHEALQMLRFQLRDAGCEVSVHLPAQPAFVLGDPAQLKQVLINLILNAIHAMEGRPEPHLFLSVTVEAGHVWLQVRDTGIGIRKEIIHRIFDPFFTTKGTRGTGLGLSISASIIRQQGGELSVESTPGQGATFTIRLPSRHPAAAGSDVEEPAAEPLSRHVASRCRVLVVDDEEFVRQLMQEALRTAFGCGIETAADGAEATVKVSNSDYDLIVSDIRMPRMDGLQLFSWLSSHRPELAERMIFVTGHAGTIELDQAMDRLRRPVIRKPFTIDAIVSTCRPYLQGAIKTDS